MPKLLFLILVTFSVSGATSIPEDLNVQELASSEDSLVASDRACLDEVRGISIKNLRQYSYACENIFDLRVKKTLSDFEAIEFKNE